MIARMEKLLVAGPKAAMDEVVEALQAQGTVHLSEVQEGEKLRSPEIRGGGPEEKMLSRVEGVLSLLPGKLEAVPLSGEESLEALEPFVQEAEAKARELTKKRLELEDERGLIQAYAEAVRILSPLLAPLEGSKAFEAIGFTVEKRKAQALELLRDEISRITEGRALVFSREVDPKTLGAVVAFRKADREALRSLFVKQGVNELRLPSSVQGLPLAEAVAVLEQRRRKLPGELEQVGKDLATLSRQAKPRLLGVRAELKDRLARREALKRFGETQRTFLLKGYVPAKASSSLKAQLRKEFGDDLLVSTEPFLPGSGHGQKPP